MEEIFDEEILENENREELHAAVIVCAGKIWPKSGEERNVLNRDCIKKFVEKARVPLVP